MIELTHSAAHRVRTYLDKRGHGAGLRLGVKETGCSGYAYVMDYADGERDGDAVFESAGVKVFVDPASLRFLDGVTVDFVKDGLNESFQFDNPNVTDECGCGESFTVN